MKDLIQILLLVIILLIMIPGQGVSQQIADTMFIKSYTPLIDSLYDYQSKWAKNNIQFQSISNIFCSLNKLERQDAEEVLTLCLQPSFLRKNEVHKFFLKNHKCFDNEQKRKVKGNLNQNLLYTDFDFHELVSLYQLHSKSEIIKLHTPSNNLLKEIKNQMKSASLDDLTKKQLRNLATLANLGYNSLEDSLLSLVKELYIELSLGKGNSGRRYHEIFYNSIPLLNSKNSILQTLYMLDLESSTPYDNQDDLAIIPPPLQYFFSCIQPKLNTKKLENLAWIDFEKNREEIKEYILHDNSIWLDHIRQ